MNVSPYKKALIGGLALLAFGLFACLAALPTWISSSSGTEAALKLINSRIPGEISAEKIELNWFGTQRVTNFSLKDAQKTEIVRLPLVETRTSLVYLLLGGRQFNKTMIEDPFVALHQNEEQDNISKALGKKKKENSHLKPKKKRVFPDFKELSLTDGTLILSSPKIHSITISDLNVQKRHNPEAYHITAATKQGEVAGNLSVTASFEREPHIVADIQNFPIAILDQFKETTLFTDALGKTLNAQMDFTRNAGTISLNSEIESPNLQCTLKGKSEGGKFSLSPETNCVFTITPGFFQHWVAASRRGEWDLASKAALSIKVQKGIFPLAFNQAFFKNSVIQAEASVDRVELSHKALGGYSLNQFTATFISSQNLEVNYKGEIRGKETSLLAGSFSFTPEGDVLFKYDYKGFPITLFEIPYPQVAEQLRLLFGKSFDAKGEGTYTNEELNTTFSLGSPEAQIKGTIEGELPELTFEAQGTTTLKGDKTQLLGTSVDFELEGTAFIQDEHVIIPELSGNLSNPNLEAEFEGKIGEVAKPFSVDQIDLDMKGFIKELPFEKDFFRQAHFTLELVGQQNQLVGKIESKEGNGEFTFTNLIRNQKLDFKQADLSFGAQYSEFHLGILNPFAPEGIDLTKLFGSTIKLETSGTYLPLQKSRVKFELNAQGTGFTSVISAEIDENRTVTQSKPAYIYWDITPERYQSLISSFFPNPERKPTFTLEKGAPLELNITHFTCPATAPNDASHFFCQTGFTGSLNIGNLIFKSPYTNEFLTIKKIEGSIEGENFSKEINLNLAGDLIAANIPPGEKSDFTFQGQMLNFWTPQGKFNRKGLTLKGELNLELIPVRQLVGIVPMEEAARIRMQALLGELINSRVSGEISQLKGSLTVDVKSSNFKALLPIQLSPEGIYLRDYVNAEITLTNEISEILFADINPLFITGALSDHPLKLYIDPKGFMIALNPFTFEGIQIERAILDIGKIRVQNGGQLQSLMDFLKATEISQDRTMDAWFTPIYLNLSKGVVYYQRFDILLANLAHLAFWGEIDLIRDRVKMTMGIAPTTLQQRFGLKGLTNEDLFQVKMRGSTQKLDMDWSAATTRIGALIAKSKGGLGLLVGGLLDLFSPANAPSPPPTTSPFPWDQ